MAVAIVQEWPREDGSTTNYDAVDERVLSKGIPSGLIFHCAGFVGDTFRIFDVWETSADFDNFMKDTLWPALEEIGAAGEAPPAITTYEVHNFHKP